MEYRVSRTSRKNNKLYHSGKRGMKWGFNDGKKNGNRTAASIATIKPVKNFKENIGLGGSAALAGAMDIIGADGRTDLIEAMNRTKNASDASNLFNKNKTKNKDPRLQQGIKNMSELANKNHKKNQVKYTILKEKYARTPLGKLEKSRAIGKNIVDGILKIVR